MIQAVRRRMRTHDMRPLARTGAFVLGLVALGACASDVPPAPFPPGGSSVTSLESVRKSALADAAQRTGLDRADLAVLSAEAVTWPDGSVGCPQPGMMYTQALVPGFRVRIRAGGEVLNYHAGRSGAPFLCPAGRAQPPVPDGSI
jgi:hypothetical protein